jgi:predicted metal-dependent HD superfamily phosphohydrolase
LYGDAVSDLEPDPRWLRLWKRFDASSGQAHTEWRELLTRYSEPWRAYHTLEHVLDCQHELDGCRSLASDPDAVEAALWFHDAVYDPRSSGNEEASAFLARDVLKRAGVTAARLERVERLILATRHAGVVEDDDGALVVDIDLAILGASEERFEQYERGVRLEYAWVPEPVFRLKRAELLEAFLCRTFLFTTQTFRTRLESQARTNLARSIERLHCAQ